MLNIQPGTKSLNAALRLLGLFAGHPEEWRVTGLADKTGLHKSQVSRILRTFADHGFLQKKNGRYRLGRAFNHYASLVKADDALTDAARPVMERLSGETQGTVVLKIREGGETVTIDRVESRHFLRLAYPLGLRLPLNASSSGKVFLAYMPPAERKRLYEAGAFRKFTAKTRTLPAQLERDLSAVRRLGFAVSDEGHVLGAVGLAAPLFGPERKLVACLGVGLPKVLLPWRKIAGTGAALRKAAADISSALGFKPENSSRIVSIK